MSFYYRRYKIHVIFDEVYALSVFEEDSHFHSILSIKNLPDPDRTHFLWGFSKVRNY